MSRDDFSRQTLEALAKRACIKRSNPRSRQPTAGTRLANSQVISVALTRF